MVTVLKVFFGKLLARFLGNFRALIVTARADDPALADFVKRLVGRAEEMYGPGFGSKKREFVITNAAVYAKDLGLEVLKVGLDALILSAMQELGLVETSGKL